MADISAQAFRAQAKDAKRYGYDSWAELFLAAAEQLEQGAERIEQLTANRDDWQNVAAARRADIEDLKAKIETLKPVGRCVKCKLWVRPVDGYVQDERGMLHSACALLLRIEALTAERDRARAELVVRCPVCGHEHETLDEASHW